jgi:hypothetical protein
MSGDGVEGKNYLMILKMPLLLSYNAGEFLMEWVRGNKILSYGMSDDLDNIKPDSLVITNEGEITSFNMTRKAKGWSGYQFKKKVALGIQVITTSL